MVVVFYSSAEESGVLWLHAVVNVINMCGYLTP